MRSAKKCATASLTRNTERYRIFRERHQEVPTFVHIYISVVRLFITIITVSSIKALERFQKKIVQWSANTRPKTNLETSGSQNFRFLLFTHVQKNQLPKLLIFRLELRVVETKKSSPRRHLNLNLPFPTPPPVAAN